MSAFLFPRRGYLGVLAAAFWAAPWLAAQAQQMHTMHLVAIGVAIFVYAGTLMDLMAQSKRKQVSKGINPVPAGDPKDWDI